MDGITIAGRTIISEYFLPKNERSVNTDSRFGGLVWFDLALSLRMHVCMCVRMYVYACAYVCVWVGVMFDIRFRKTLTAPCCFVNSRLNITGWR